MNKIVVATSGASGVNLGLKTLELLPDSIEKHFIMSKSSKLVLKKELGVTTHKNEDISASIASGSFITLGMMVMPCSIKSLSGIVHSYADCLLSRAADVCLKEKRKLLLSVRETPLHRGHLEMMARADELGAMILPPMPAFYHDPQTIDDIVDQTVGKAFDYFGIEHDLFRRWGQPGKDTD